jgi:formylglycine-generating enzyme required for sulfatase activity
MIYLLALLTLLAFALGGAYAQGTTPQEDYQTAQALVGQYFTLTAVASANPGVILTAQDGIFYAQTATATAEFGKPTATPAPATETSVAITTQARMTPFTAQPGELVIPSLDNIQKSELRWVTGGTFDMGTTQQEIALAVNQCVNLERGKCTTEMGADSAPPHRVTVDPFQMEETEVSFAQYVAFLNTLGPNRHKDGCDGQPCAITRAEDKNSNILFDGKVYTVPQVVSGLPAVDVTWYGAQAYCEAIGRHLPSEAEWEFAARGADGRIYPWGNTWDPTFAKTSIPVSKTPGPVDIFAYPNGQSPFGIFNLAGNVAEWTYDWYSDTYYTELANTNAVNPVGPRQGQSKVVRGGSWDAKPFFARSVHRQSYPPELGGAWLGFRCATYATSVSPTPSEEPTLPLVVNETMIPPTLLTLSPPPSAQASATLPPPTPSATARP